MITSLGCTSEEVILEQEKEIVHIPLEISPKQSPSPPPQRIDYPLYVGPKNGKTIYLTFDDGPSQYTGTLLDNLAKYDKFNVKVTFFVTNMRPEYIDNIKRAHNEGHSIGVHTYCHEYSKIYASEEAYIEDFNAMQKVIYEQTGEYSPIFRFPGGSSNTISKNNVGIMTRLAKMMDESGAVYFDWNVDSGDAENNGQTNQEKIERMKAGVQNRTNSVILLHDTKASSVDCIEQFIIWALGEGYTFEPLKTDSPLVRHKISN